LPKTRRKKTSTRLGPYSEGNPNSLIDDFCHPLAKLDKRVLLLDTLLHFLVEKDLPRSLKKLVRYHLSDIMRELLGEGSD
jgi:hypothetical protein